VATPEKLIHGENRGLSVDLDWTPAETQPSARSQHPVITSVIRLAVPVVTKGLIFALRNRSTPVEPQTSEARSITSADANPRREQPGVGLKSVQIGNANSAASSPSSWSAGDIAFWTILAVCGLICLALVVDIICSDTARPREAPNEQSGVLLRGAPVQDGNAHRATQGDFHTGAPSCAENGSCFGDISPRTGKHKDVYVPGYYRKNGILIPPRRYY
jgi:hypothetical protein